MLRLSLAIVRHRREHLCVQFRKYPTMPAIMPAIMKRREQPCNTCCKLAALPIAVFNNVPPVPPYCIRALKRLFLNRQHGILSIADLRRRRMDSVKARLVSQTKGIARKLGRRRIIKIYAIYLHVYNVSIYYSCRIFLSYSLGRMHDY